VIVVESEQYVGWQQPSNSEREVEEHEEKEEQEKQQQQYQQG
jgi:hypothetical protein